MEENRQKPVETGKKLEKPGTFKKGDDPRRNLDGRPKGSESFSTKWYRMIEKIADSNDITPDQVEEELLKVGYKRAKDGDYSFYRDAMDRIHGKPVQPNEHNVNGVLTIQFSDDFKK